MTEDVEKFPYHLPSRLVDSVLSQRDTLEGSERQIAVMLCKKKASERKSRKFRARESRTFRDPMPEIVIPKIYQYEGTVNELGEDSVLALFGASVPLDSPAKTAIQCSLEMHRDMAAFDQDSGGDESPPPASLRIGISAGPVVVGSIGNDLRVQLRSGGDIVDLASRIAERAEPGTTCVSEGAFTLAAGAFPFEALDQQKSEGEKKSLRVYRVIAPTRRSEFKVFTEDGLTRFVGRQREIGLLLNLFEHAKKGKGQACKIVGEAGAGKSRLLYEFRKFVTNENAAFLEAKCMPYANAIPLYLVSDLLRSRFGIQVAETDSKIRKKVPIVLPFRKLWVGAESAVS